MHTTHILHLLEYYEDELNKLSCGPYLSHLKTMFEPMRKMVHKRQIQKLNRWIGFIQGVLFSNGLFTIDQMRSHNRSYGSFIKEINK